MNTFGLRNPQQTGFYSSDSLGPEDKFGVARYNANIASKTITGAISPQILENRATLARGSGLRGAPTPRSGGAVPTTGGFAGDFDFARGGGGGFAGDFDFARRADFNKAIGGLMDSLSSGQGLTRQQGRAFEALSGLMNFGLQQQRVGNDALYQQGSLANSAADSLRNDQNTAAQQQNVRWQQALAAMVQVRKNQAAAYEADLAGPKEWRPMSEEELYKDIRNYNAMTTSGPF